MAELRKIYRVEHPSDKCGPYSHYWTPPDALRKMFDRHNTSSKHPTPNENTTDTLRYCANGFHDMEQLRDWFDDEDLAMMFGLGFVVVEIEINADAVRYLEKQVLFKPDRIILKKTLDMSLEMCYTLENDN